MVGLKGERSSAKLGKNVLFRHEAYQNPELVAIQDGFGQEWTGITCEVRTARVDDRAERGLDGRMPNELGVVGFNQRPLARWRHRMVKARAAWLYNEDSVTLWKRSRVQLNRESGGGPSHTRTHATLTDWTRPA